MSDAVFALPAEMEPARNVGGGRRLIYMDLPKPRTVNEYSHVHIHDAMKRAGLPVCSLAWRNSRQGLFLSKVLMKLKLLRNVRRGRSDAYLVPVLYLSEYNAFPVCYFHEIIPYSYDVWPNRWDDWEQFYRRHKIKVAFITAQQSANEMRRRVPGMEVIWAPEAVDINDHISDKPLHTRNIDVLELGRKYDQFHNQVTIGLANAGRVHLFERGRGNLVFATREGLIQGFSEARMTVCFPAVITHPEYASGIETATLRYYQTCASRSLPFGRAPKELIDLFGYNPVVEVDMKDPLGQVTHILENIEEYQPLVDRNYQRLLEVGTWEVRAKQIVRELRQRGYNAGNDPDA